jgi:hypothetical protein
MTFESICPQCGNKIPESLEACPECASGASKGDAAPLFLIIALLCASFLMLGSSIVNVVTAPAVKATKTDHQDLNLSAYFAARQFIQERFPGPKAFAEFEQASINHQGNFFEVTIPCEDISDPNAPVRNYFRVKMEFSGGRWILQEIFQ